MKKILILFIIITLSYSDVIIKKDGKEIYGEIISISTSTTTIYQPKIHNKIFISNNEILKIEIQKTYDKADEYELNDFKDKDALTLIKKYSNQETTIKKYPQADSIILFDKKFIKIREDGSYTVTIHMLQKILNEKGKNQATVILTYNPLIGEKFKLNFARSITADKIIYITDQTVKEASVILYKEYDKIKSVKFDIPEVVENSFIEYQYTIDYPPESNLNPFYYKEYFISEIPVIKKEIIFEIAKNKNIFTFSQHSDTFKIEDKNNKNNRIIILSKKEIKAYVPEYFMPDYSFFAPSFTICADHQYTEITADIKKTLTEKKYQLEDYPEIAELINNVIRNCQNDIDKIKAVYNFVSLNLLPVTKFSQTSVMFKPTSPEVIFNTGRSSAFDKTFLLYNILNYLKIDSDIYLINNSIYEKKNDFPHVNSDNVILYLKNINKYISTENPFMTVFDYNPAYFEADLLNITGSFEIKKLPAREGFENSSIQTNILTIDQNGNAQFEITKIFRNDYSYRILKNLNNQQINTEMEKISAQYGKNSTLKSFEIQNIENTFSNIIFNLTITINDFVQKAGEKAWAFEIPDFFLSPYGVGENQRNFPVFIGSKNFIRKIYVINIPEGFKVKNDLQNIKISSAGLSFTLNYEKPTARQIIITSEYIRETIFEDKDFYFKYKTFIEKRALLTKEWILLEKSG